MQRVSEVREAERGVVRTRTRRTRKWGCLRQCGRLHHHITSHHRSAERRTVVASQLGLLRPLRSFPRRLIACDDSTDTYTSSLTLTQHTYLHLSQVVARPQLMFYRIFLVSWLKNTFSHLFDYLKQYFLHHLEDNVFTRLLNVAYYLTDSWIEGCHSDPSLVLVGRWFKSQLG